MNHRDYVIIGKLIREVEIAEDFIRGLSLEEFSDNEMVRRAVCMTVINIGELVKTLTEPSREKYKEVSWKEAAGFRDIAAHKYQTLDMGDVYKTIKEDFPVFLGSLEKIREQEEDERT